MAVYDGGGSFSGYGAYAPIGGSLSFGGSTGKSYEADYRSSANFNSSNYDNILRGYQQSLANHSASAAAIDAGYNNMYSEVINQIKGIGSSRDQDIMDSAKVQAGRGSQSMIDRGQGNTSAMESMTRGVESDKQRNLNANANMVSGLTAQYQNQIRGAQLAAQQRGANELLGIQGSQLGFMNSVSGGYPDRKDYLDKSASGGGFGGGSFGGAGGGIVRSTDMGRPVGGFAPSYGPSAYAPSQGGGQGWLGAQSSMQYGGGGGGWGGSSYADAGGGLGYSGGGDYGQMNSGFNFAGAGGAVATGAYDQLDLGYGWGGDY